MGKYVLRSNPMERDFKAHSRFLAGRLFSFWHCDPLEFGLDPIYARYERLLDGGTKPTLAKLRLARMIAATVLRMWKDEKEYDPGRASPTAKNAKARTRLDLKN